MSYGCFTDKQSFSNLFVLETFANECDYFSFSPCKTINPRLFRTVLGRLVELTNHRTHHHAIYPHFPLVYFLDRLEKHFGRMFLEDNTHGAPMNGCAMRVGIF